MSDELRRPEAAPPTAASGPPGADPGVRTVVVARHGRTEWNATARYQGHADIPLDDEGRMQAVRLAERLAIVAPARIVSSDLRRARDTAAPLVAVSGAPLHVDPRLREVDVGRWEGMTQEQVQEAFPDEWARWKDGADIARGGGETRADAGRRAVTAVLEHAGELPPGAALVVVSHGMVLRSAVRLLAASGAVALDHDPPHLGNGAWMELRVTLSGS